MPARRPCSKVASAAVDTKETLSTPENVFANSREISVQTRKTIAAATCLVSRLLVDVLLAHLPRQQSNCSRRVTTVLPAQFWSAKSGTNVECRLDHPARDLSSVFLGWIGSGVFKEKLRSIVNGVRANQAFLPPIRDRLYRNVARSAISEMVSIPRSRRRSKRLFSRYAFRM